MAVTRSGGILTTGSGTRERQLLATSTHMPRDAVRGDSCDTCPNKVPQTQPRRNAVISLQLRVAVAATAAIAATTAVAAPNISASAATAGSPQRGVVARPDPTDTPAAHAPAGPLPARQYGVIGFTATAKPATAKPASISTEASSRGSGPTG